jgi:hypothetical protein
LDVFLMQDNTFRNLQLNKDTEWPNVIVLLQLFQVR